MVQHHLCATKLFRKSIGLSKYQFFWLTFCNGLLIGYVLALLAHRQRLIRGDRHDAVVLQVKCDRPWSPHDARCQQPRPER